MSESKSQLNTQEVNLKKSASNEIGVIKKSSDSIGSDEQSSEEDDKQIGRGVGSASVTVSREEYLQAHRDLTFERNQLQWKNNILHKRLAEYYKKRKQEHVLKRLEDSIDLEEKYEYKLYSYKELKEKHEREICDIRAKVKAVQTQYAEQLEHGVSKFDALQNHEKNTGTGLIYSKRGKPIADKTVHRLLNLQRRKSEQMTNMRLKYIRVRNAVAELESVVRNLERIGPGLYVAQYEQLHVDNRNFMNKVEEREDELIKNRSKCTEHNQIIAHIREKMHHTDEVIDIRECDLGDAQIEYNRAREDLGQVKGRRDRLRWCLDTEHLKAGLLTKKDLLRDFQDAIDNVVQLRERKQRLEFVITKIKSALQEARKSMQQQNQTHDDASDEH